MSQQTAAITIFVGPTGRLEEECVSVLLQPLVGPGDLEERIKSHSQPGIIAIVDGWFYQRAALSHEEIRSALRMGWQVWGMSAFGAIRAYELRHIGMLGFGKVFEHFCERRDMTDDEVLCLHSENSPYRPISEPLINFKEALCQLTQQKMLTDEIAARILKALSETWFGHRTLQRFGSFLSHEGGMADAAVESVLTDFDRFRVGLSDLRDFLSVRPWIDHKSAR